MDENETDPSVNNNNNTEYKSESDNSCNKSYLKTKCNIDQIIEEIIGNLLKKNELAKKNANLRQKLAIFISRSAEKDYFPKLIFLEESDECSYRELLDSITTIEDELQQASKNSLTKINSLEEEIKAKREHLIELKISFKAAIERTALHAVNSETGEHLSPKEVKELLAKEEEVSKNLEEYQLYSIKKRHNLNSAMEQKKNLAEGPLDYAEYEMMNIETQNNKEIIQPMSEEIKNIMKKASNVINVLSHLGQKLYLAQKEKGKALNEEKKLEAELNEMRDTLFEEKMKYTKMKDESKELQHKFILLQHPRLIEDYHSVQQKNKEAHTELERLKATYEANVKIINK